jgi:hypothetical protein
MAVAGVRVEAWRVHDTGLVAVPSRFRRLGGLVRHLQGHGERWPDQVTLELTDDDELRVTSGPTVIGAWPRDDVRATRQSDGPPVQLVLEVPGGSQLLAAAAGASIETLLAELARAPS